MIGVIDASALIRLFVPDGPLPEGLEEFLLGVERGRDSAIAPELLLAETANVLHRKRKLGELSEDESAQLLTGVLSMPIRLLPHRPIQPRSFDMAGEHDLTVYDALYLALAVEFGAVLFTADKSLSDVAAILHLR